MKNQMKKLAVLIVGLVTVFSFIQCTKAEDTTPTTTETAKSTAVVLIDQIAESENSTESMDDIIACVYTCVNGMPYEELSEAEVNTLNFMREEEFLAHDIYVNLFAAYNLPVFNNISNSETIHTTAIKALMEKYSLTDPAADHQTGVFVNTDIQALYNALLEQGLLSINDAVVVGATIEDYDIADLLSHLNEGTDNEDILFVLQQLYRGSRNHMRAFSAHMTFRDITYVPQYISLELYNQIIGSEWEIGNGFCTCSATESNPIFNMQTQ
jgi:hypothetical protein